jgi:hypothetical protein
MFHKDTNVDVGMWPILIIKEADSDDPGIVERSLSVVEELYETKKEPYVTVIDGRAGRRPSPAQRYLQTEFRRKYEDHVKQYSRGTAIVTKSEILKAVVSAMFWLKAPDNVAKMFTDMESAIEWARDRLEA